MAPNYQLSRIYIIRNTVNERCYCGSTVRTLAERMYEHRKRARGEAREGDMAIIKAMREHGEGAFHIELVKDFPCERRENLNAEEGKCIREMNTMIPNGYNVYIAGRTPAAYRAENRDVLNQKMRAWHHANKDAMRERRRQYYTDHKVEFAAKAKEYYAVNPDKNVEKTTYIKKWRDANPDKVNAYQKKSNRKYAMANPEKVAERARAYRATHPDALTKYRREYEAANRVKINQKMREYRAAHKLAIQASSRERRATKLASATEEQQVVMKDSLNQRSRERYTALPPERKAQMYMKNRQALERRAATPEQQAAMKEAKNQLAREKRAALPPEQQVAMRETNARRAREWRAAKRAAALAPEPADV